MQWYPQSEWTGGKGTPLKTLGRGNGTPLNERKLEALSSMIRTKTPAHRLLKEVETEVGDWCPWDGCLHKIFHRCIDINCILHSCMHPCTFHTHLRTIKDAPCCTVQERLYTHINITYTVHTLEYTITYPMHPELANKYTNRTWLALTPDVKIVILSYHGIALLLSENANMSQDSTRGDSNQNLHISTDKLSRSRMIMSCWSFPFLVHSKLHILSRTIHRKRKKKGQCLKVNCQFVFTHKLFSREKPSYESGKKKKKKASTKTVKENNNNKTSCVSVYETLKCI